MPNRPAERQATSDQAIMSTLPYSSARSTGAPSTCHAIWNGGSSSMLSRATSLSREVRRQRVYWSPHGRFKVEYL